MKNVNICRHKLSTLLVYTIILGIASLTLSSCSTHRAIRLSNESNTEEVKWEEAWDESSPSMSKKLSRVQTFRGSWNFTSINHDSILAVYSVQFDPKRMPLWLAEPMVNNLLIDGLENMRKMTSK